MSSLRPILALAILFALATPFRLAAMARTIETSGYEDRFYLPAPEWLVAFSLGHREALADLLWMRTLVYYGDEIQHQGQLQHIFEYTEAMLMLDPDFRAPYAWIGTLGVYRPQDTTAEEVERVVAIMERGVERFPDDGPLAWEMGATLAFELPRLHHDHPELANRARERGAHYIMRAEELGAAPPYAALVSERLLARVGRAELAISHLQEVYATTTDLDLQNEIALRIASIQSDALGAAFTEANQEFEDRWGHEMPYASPALYYLVGPVPVVDTTATLRDGFAADAVRNGEQPIIE